MFKLTFREVMSWGCLYPYHLFFLFLSFFFFMETLGLLSRFREKYYKNKNIFEKPNKYSVVNKEIINEIKSTKY